MENEEPSVNYRIKVDAPGNEPDILLAASTTAASHSHIESVGFSSKCSIQQVPDSFKLRASSTCVLQSGTPAHSCENSSPTFSFSIDSLPHQEYVDDPALHQSSSDPGPVFSKVEHPLCSALDWGLPPNFDACIDEIMTAGQINPSNRQGLIARITKLADFGVNELNSKGYFGVSKLLGGLYATNIRDLFLSVYSQGNFQPGEHAQKGEEAIRNDLISWIGPDNLLTLPSSAIRILLAFLDGVIMQMSARLDGVSLGYKTRAMLACYPGRATGYGKHFDNPNVLSDGRYLTCIYYLNSDWIPARDGGELVLWPSILQGQEVILAPILDRAVFFFSDERTLHKVRPSMRERYALTMWYFDTAARQKYWERRRQSLTKIRRVSIPIPPRELHSARDAE